MSRRCLQGTLCAISAIATVAGISGVTRGAAELVDPGPISANVDSEYRFYAAWYLTIGVLLLEAARDPQHETATIRACAAGYFIAACGRARSARLLGPPHRIQRILMWIEFAIPAVIVPWQRHVSETLER